MRFIFFKLGIIFNSAMNQSMETMLKYPTIILDNSEIGEYRGYLPVNDVDYEIFIKYENFTPDLRITLQLKQFEDDIIQLIETSKRCKLVDFLDGLREIIKRKSLVSNCRNYTNMYRQVLNEYVELREFYISLYKCSISQDLSQITISHLDEMGRIHNLLINCDFQDPMAIFKVADYSLPDKKFEQLFLNCNSLKDIYDKFIGLIDVLQLFFDIMDNLDANCWILDPEKPNRKDCYRRIGLDTNISMIITFNPWNNVQIPDIKFLGPDRLVESYREKLANNLFNWNSKEYVVHEILKVLEMPYFPQRPTDLKEAEVLCNTGECCICFSLRLNDQLPEIVCGNPSCEQFYHTSCLYQWLVSVSAKPCFNELHGQCPNCEKVCMEVSRFIGKGFNLKFK